MIDTKQMLAAAIKNSASDVHINVGMPPIMRINTELIMMDLPEVSNEDAGRMILEMIGEDKFKLFLEKRDWDFSTMIEDGSRFRVNAHFQKETFALSFRAISNSIPDIEDLHLPEVVKELTDLPRGLVLVTGHTGSGKSTTLASMINEINRKYRKRIITLEDPVEYLMENKSCMIEQREIGSDCPSFASGLRHALRQDPDIILVGEMRDLETTSSTITAAETGHLVLSTLHTINASQTVERIIDVYPPSQQNQIRAMLANTLQAVISQTLFRRVDQPGMVPCTEILLCTSAVRNCIRENRIYEIPNIIETSRRLGMQTMDHSIQQMYIKGYIDRDEAIIRATNPGKMEKILPATPQGALQEQV
ncbi:MAG TPA: type IV pilus twitching motility protein PilT [Anaerohalosphaeraceae bacterium]|nr:type IV pilus twitching motility protein PilT [Phycisphaerae bacterium]HOK94638.1 type IV pilus twitching motility protein PilT [Anaerohalosphaeraceae bacterium]HOL30895.1 type IV pilus twitching motility protein PilT [Anaerohalosphaeraceae bacterium]HOM76039.1 type IV pilus twitching motility protein PilT [Anaerohalosphaeraceae bacterium]HPC64211.1 type IV pilus twitching motility protein PilT [Anaerohalosphaeraceae bacterium]